MRPAAADVRRAARRRGQRGRHRRRRRPRSRCAPTTGRAAFAALNAAGRRSSWTAARCASPTATPHELQQILAAAGHRSASSSRCRRRSRSGCWCSPAQTPAPPDNTTAPALRRPGGPAGGSSTRRRGRTRGAPAGSPAPTRWPPGATGHPWSVPVSFTAPPGTVLTVAVSTGGHVAAVERFALTGVRVASRTAPVLADGRHATRITRVDPTARRITVDVVQIFFGADAARAAREAGAPEVPPPNGVWLSRNAPTSEVFVPTVMPRCPRPVVCVWRGASWRTAGRCVGRPSGSRSRRRPRCGGPAGTGRWARPGWSTRRAVHTGRRGAPRRDDRACAPPSDRRRVSGPAGCTTPADRRRAPRRPTPGTAPRAHRSRWRRTHDREDGGISLPAGCRGRRRCSRRCSSRRGHVQRRRECAHTTRGRVPRRGSRPPRLPPTCDDDSNGVCAYPADDRPVRSAHQPSTCRSATTPDS